MGAFPGWNLTPRTQLRLVAGGGMRSTVPTGRVVSLRVVEGLRPAPTSLGARRRRRRRTA